ncbi:MAG: hypothetical protein DMG69_01735 [Acidobacteria bacterium]|nr:MAG: hypothetical protein DMG69_01735 [Acidobacteriota bacterium]
MFQSLEQFVERGGVVDGGESIEIARGGFMGNLGSAVEVGNAPAEPTPGHAAFAVALLAPVDAEVVAVVDGGLGTQDAAFGSVGLVVEGHRELHPLIESQHKVFTSPTHFIR